LSAMSAKFRLEVVDIRNGKPVADRDNTC